MALVPRQITINEALHTMVSLIAEIRTKNTTMINYYIYPGPIPTSIAAFGPGIDALERRVTSLASVFIPNVTLLIDDGPAWIAGTLRPIIDQLAAAVDRFQVIFIEHYDPSLKERLPYLNIWQNLKDLKTQLSAYIEFQYHNNPNRRPAEALQFRPSTEHPSLCRSAVGFLNGADKGTVITCLQSDLTAENRARLLTHRGAFLWWECPSCAFRLRFHLSDSAHAAINNTDEVRTHADIHNLEYRSSWLVKCHLHHPGREQYALDRERRRSSALLAGTDKKRVSISSSSPFGLPINTAGVGGVKYGCIICYAMGKEFDVKETCFATAKEFADHLSEEHADKKEMPPGLLLEKFHVGVKGQMAPGVKRWDVNFL